MEQEEKALWISPEYSKAVSIGAVTLMPAQWLELVELAHAFRDHVQEMPTNRYTVPLLARLTTLLK